MERRTLGAAYCGTPQPAPTAADNGPDDIDRDERPEGAVMFERAGRAPAFDHGHGSQGPAVEGATRATEAEDYARRLAIDVGAVERLLGAAGTRGDELRRRLRIATFLRTKATPLVGDAAPGVQDELRALFRALDDHEAAAHALIGWTPKSMVAASSAIAAPSLARFQVALDAAGYFSFYQWLFFDAIRERLAAASLPAPHHRLVWAGGPAALAAAFGPAFDATVGHWEVGKQLPSLLHPIDPLALIDRHRTLDTGRPGETIDGQPARGKPEASAIAARALAIEVEGALRRSLPRMGVRYVALADDYHGTVTPELLVASHPFDRIVARLLCDASVARFVPRAGKPAKRRDETDAPAAFKHGLRHVVFEWQGARDPKLWNWVRVVEPLDATAEELCAWLFERNDGRLHTEYAYGLVAAPPFFRVPPRWARDLPDAAAHKPTQEDDATADAEPASALALVESRFADDVARAQAGEPAARVDRGTLARTLLTNQGQLQAAAAQLSVWRLDERVRPALRWVIEHRDAITAAPDQTLGVWAAIAQAQQGILADALGDVMHIVLLAEERELDPAAAEAGPLRGALDAFAIAIGESHLRQTATHQLVTAQQRMAQLPLALLGQALRDNRDTARELAALGPPPGDPADRGRTAEQTNRSLEAHALELRSKVVARGAIDLAALDAATVATAEATLANRLHAIDSRAGQLVQAIRATVRTIDVDLLVRLPRRLTEVQTQARTILATMRRDALPVDPAGGPRAFADARRAAVNAAHGALAALAKDKDLEQLFSHTLDAIHHAQVRALIGDLVLLIGISIVGAAAGAWVGGLVRGSMLAHAAVDTLAFARLAARARTVGTAANVMTEAAVTATGGTLVTGGDTKLSFAENLMASLLTLGALRPIHTLTRRLGAVDQQARGMWRVISKGKAAFVHAGTFTLELLVGAGASYVASQIAHGSPPKDDQQAISWAMNGAAMAVGHFVMRRTGPLQARLARLGEHGAHLRTRLATQEALTRKLMRGGTTEEALVVLEEHTHLIEAEAALLADPKLVARLGLDGAQLETLRAGNRTALDDTRSQELDVMKLRFRGLEPLASNGTVWAGTRGQIDAVIGDAGRAATDSKSDEAPRHRTAEINGRRITFVEVAPSDLRPATARATGVAGPDLHTHFMGVTDVGYFVDKLGQGDAVRAFDAAYALLSASQQAAPHGWGIATKTRSKLDGMIRDGASPEARRTVAEDGLRRMLAAGEGTGFDLTYAVRQILVEQGIDRGGGPYRNYTRDTMTTLAAEGVGYSEQSVGLGKLDAKFPEAMMKELHAELAGQGKDVDVRFLAMLPTKALAGAVSADEAAATVRALERILARGDVQGLDVAGPEKYRFTPEGMKNFRTMYAAVAAAAKLRGRSLVLRPHVGEGYHEGHAGTQHVELARANLETLIGTLEAMGYSPAQAAKDGVDIRFGHAAHATDGQIARMAKLGIIVEANIGSNVITKSIITPDDHPLLFNLYYGLRTVLGTDGQGVMRTDRRAEYETARKLIAEFRRGKAALKFSDDRLVRFGDLTSEQQARFSLDAIAKTEDDYHQGVRTGDRADTARRKEDTSP